jgi:hypothetical protein
VESFTHTEGSKRAEEIGSTVTVKIIREQKRLTVQSQFFFLLLHYLLFPFIDFLLIHFFSSLCVTLMSIGLSSYLSSMSLIFPLYLPVFLLFIATTVVKSL